MSPRRASMVAISPPHPLGLAVSDQTPTVILYFQHPMAPMKSWRFICGSRVWPTPATTCRPTMMLDTWLGTGGRGQSLTDIIGWSGRVNIG